MTPSEATTGADGPADRAAEWRVVAYVATLLLGTVATVLAGLTWDLVPPGNGLWLGLPFLAAALVAAEQLRIRYRRGSDVDAITLFEAVLAPLLFTFPPHVVVVTVAISQAITAVLRRTVWIKAAFNISMWSLAAGVGSLVLGLLVRESGATLESLGFLVIALAAVAVVNNTAFTVVLAISGRQSLTSVLRGLAPIIVPGWIGGWLVNLLMGLLFVLADAGHPIAVVLFPMPLVVLHLAYRGYASARTDRRRLTGLRAAVTALSEPLRPFDAIDDYLCEVVRGFESRAAALVVLDETGEYDTYLLAPPASTAEERQTTPLERTLANASEPTRVAATDGHPLATKLADAGWRECLCAPLVDEHRRLGVLIVYDRTGLEGTATADLVVLEALARETAHTLARGRLFESVLEERRKLDQIVSTTSDGIFTLGEDGSVLSWNSACERITGLTEAAVLGQRDTMQCLEARTTAGSRVDFSGWAADPALPHDIVITTLRGAHRRLSCSTSPAADVDGRSETLVVVARDITPVEEHEELREQLSRLAEAQAAQRLVVDHLQKAVAPEPPEIEGADLAVNYVASDPSSPTGGDLYDWHLLPSGELHLAVVDVLGHGVAATKAALTVVHTLRFIAVEGTPLDRVVARADSLLSAQDSDLVATVVVARYNPATGDLRVASGGHPPALVVGADGEVTQIAATGGAIGWPAVGSDNVVTVRLRVHESLVLYTDGLIEARKDILEGMDSLVRHASEVAYLPAQRLAEELVDRALSGADRRDDSLALVLRRTRVRARPERMRWCSDPADAAAVKSARRGLLEWLTNEGRAADDPLLVASELLANAVNVARDSVVLTAELLDGLVVLEVSDDGPGDANLDSRGRRLPDADSEAGRGLFLVRCLSEQVTILSTTEGTVIRCSVAARRRSAATDGASAGRLVGPGR
ncbi:MAG: SpoIIE family protein phosphatase [Actinomycetota bacterium]|nr:SpoIIE family protein phosphatase [Actinomycetota bacterium]